MSKHLKFLRSCALSLLLTSPAFAADEVTSETVLATVDGVDVTVGQMIVVRETLPEQYQSLPDDVLFNAILDQIIQQQLLAQSYKGNDPKRLVFTLENQRRLMLAEAAIEETLDAGVSAEDVQTRYEEKFVANYEGAPEFDASHILVETVEKAAEVRQEILDGAEFAEMAKAHSTGPTGPSGGALGWFESGQMVQPFEQAVTQMQVGDISEPVQTQFGWHIIKLNDMRTKKAPSLEEVQEQLVVEIQEQIIDAKVAALTEAADIDRSGAEGFDPAILRKSELLEAVEDK